MKDLEQAVSFLKSMGVLVSAPASLSAVPVAGVCADSRKILPDHIFAAVSGSKLDGRRFIPQAIAAGAKAVAASADVPESAVPVIKVSNDYLALALLASFFADEPEKDMDFYAVTGTNGKTTTVYTLRALDNEPSESGIFTTITTGIGNDFHPSAQTTPDAVNFFSALAQMKKAGCKRVYFEASSHALSQYRMGMTKLKSAVFTNFTQDHLDYHGTMENYYQAKKVLFSRYLAEGGRAVINIADPAGERLKRELQKEYGGKFEYADFGTPDSSYPLEILPASEGCKFRLAGRLFTSNLTGTYNVFNIAGAVLASGIENAPEHIEVSVPGRLEEFVRADGAKLYVDFAHTPDALERVLTELKKITGKRLIAVFGAGGDRDQKKRPLMGAAVSSIADIAVVTSDNPRSEDPDTIISHIKSGMDLSDCEIFTEPDRAKAIQLAAAMAGCGDILLIAGKGHENTQESGGRKDHFSDAEEAEKAGFTKKI